MSYFPMYNWNLIQNRFEILSLYANGVEFGLDSDSFSFLDLSQRIANKIEKGEISWIYLHNDIINQTNATITAANAIIQAIGQINKV